MEDLAQYNDLQAFIVAHESEQAGALGELLWRTLQPLSVIDIGCGPGIYLLPFEAHNCHVLGVDGAPMAGKAIRGRFIPADLRLGWRSTLHFDLALCIEVAEHLAPEYADILMDTVCGAADTVFFSAAHPGQGGQDHLNEQPRAYWVTKFAERGFVWHPQHDQIVGEINGGDVYQRVQWLCDNAMVMTRATR